MLNKVKPYNHVFLPLANFQNALDALIVQDDRKYFYFESDVCWKTGDVVTLSRVGSFVDLVFTSISNKELCLCCRGINLFSSECVWLKGICSVFQLHFSPNREICLVLFLQNENERFEKIYSIAFFFCFTAKNLIEMVLKTYCWGSTSQKFLSELGINWLPLLPPSRMARGVTEHDAAAAEIASTRYRLLACVSFNCCDVHTAAVCASEPQRGQSRINM